MNKLKQLSKKQFNDAKALYIKALCNKAMGECLEPIQLAFETYCQYEDLQYEDGTCGIQIDVFVQQDLNYQIGIHTTPHKNSTVFCKKHKIDKSIVKWETYPLTKEGIQKMLEKNENLFEKVAFYSDVEVINLYALATIVAQMKNKNIQLTHILLSGDTND